MRFGGVAAAAAVLTIAGCSSIPGFVHTGPAPAPAAPQAPPSAPPGHFRIGCQVRGHSAEGQSFYNAILDNPGPGAVSVYTLSVVFYGANGKEDGSAQPVWEQIVAAGQSMTYHGEINLPGITTCSVVNWEAGQ
jgi:hypothetical protein